MRFGWMGSRLRLPRLGFALVDDLVRTSDGAEPPRDAPSSRLVKPPPVQCRRVESSLFVDPF